MISAWLLSIIPKNKSSVFGGFGRQMVSLLAVIELRVRGGGEKTDE